MMGRRAGGGVFRLIFVGGETRRAREDGRAKMGDVTAICTIYSQCAASLRVYRVVGGAVQYRAVPSAAHVAIAGSAPSGA